MGMFSDTPSDVCFPWSGVSHLEETFRGQDLTTLMIPEPHLLLAG